MPVQRTFTLIQPVPAAAAASPVQPMTSKQVRKAYKAATRAPAMSRAERARQERADQDRVRRELDRDRAAARARAARERKREREVGERDERRRKGLPLADVRPSQDTIAKFVRGGNGSGRRSAVAAWGEGGEEEAYDDDDDKHLGPRGGLRAAAEGSVGADLMPDEDELSLETLEQLDTAVAASLAASVNGQSHEPGAARTDQSSSPAAPGRSAHAQPRPATRYELDLGLRDGKPDSTPPAPRKGEPLKPVPPAARPVSPPCPAGTQAILCDLDEYFPSSSQQERELREEMAAVDAPPHPPEPPPPPAASASPRRFFTASGDRELVTLALQRSRRSAALEEVRQRERQRRGAPPREPALLSREAADRACQPHTPKMAVDALRKEGASSRASNSPSGPDKENVAPGSGACYDMSASQETEYGGEWVDEIAVYLDDFTTYER